MPDTRDKREVRFKVTASNYNIFVGLRGEASAKDEVVEAIYPSEPLEDSITELGLLDRGLLNFYSPFLYAFENKDGTPGFMDPKRLKRSLSEALSRVPLLSGELQNLDGTSAVIQPTANLRVESPGPGVWFAHEETKGDFQYLKEQHFNYEVLAPSIRFKAFVEAFEGNQANGIPVMAVKASYF